jgi:hypothetical protein
MHAVAGARIYTFPNRTVAEPSQDTRFAGHWEGFVSFAMLACMLGLQAGVVLAALGVIRIGH